MQRSSHLESEILTEIFRFRRVIDVKSSCAHRACKHCMEPHIAKTRQAIKTNQPLSFILPAFPGKSPNPRKVLGHLPDMAERLALEFLNSLCMRIKRIYPPGAEIIVCSDGRVFSDIIGIPDWQITEYQRALARMIADTSGHNIAVFSLDDVYHQQDFDTKRARLMSAYGTSLVSLRQRVRRGASIADISLGSADHNTYRLFCGITRFLVEDATTPEQTKTRSAIQKQSRRRAYEVILRSDAWSRLIADHHPQSIRLSIHPQTCGSQKIGIQLVGNQTWMTPWHGVAVQTATGFQLMKRHEAELLSADLIYDELGRPSHYDLLGPSLPPYIQRIAL